MSRRSTNMMANTSNKFEVIGPAVRADSYFGYTDGLHTVSVHFSNFTGRVKIQGTLAMEPTDVDWFDIHLDGQVEYVQYPKDPQNPSTYSNGTGFRGDSGVDAFTFVGNFTHLRATVEREYLGLINQNQTINNLGVIDKVLLSL